MPHASLQDVICACPPQLSEAMGGKARATYRSHIIVHQRGPTSIRFSLVHDKAEHGGGSAFIRAQPCMWLAGSASHMKTIPYTSLMSFGFSVGDFVAVGKLAIEIATSLQAIGGARSEYQELVRELRSLDAALCQLDRLDSGAGPSQHVSSIKCVALSCRHPLEEFLAKVKKYEKSLGTWSRPSVVSSATHKLRWTFGHSDDVKRLQTYLNVHIGTINILLAEHGLEKMDLSDRTAETNAQAVRA